MNITNYDTHSTPSSHTSYFTINRDVFFKTISDSFPDHDALLSAVKNDVHRMECSINGVVYHSYVEYVDILRKKYPSYLETILLLSNQNAHFLYFNMMFRIITKHNLHIICATDDTESQPDVRYLQTRTIINPMVKQVVLYNLYKVIDVQPDNVEVLKYCLIRTIVDLVVLEPIVFQIIYLDHL